ncbi:MAG: sensor histidine kinase [Hyphomicrobiales bacterium]
MELKPSSPRLFPEEVLNKLITRYQEHTAAERVDIFMVYDHGEYYRCIIVGSTEEGYAGRWKTSFNIPTEKWQDEKLVLDNSLAEHEADVRQNAAALFVDGWHIQHSDATKNLETTDQPLSLGPVAIVKLIGSTRIELEKGFREAVEREIANALWLSRSHRFLESTLLLQGLSLNSPKDKFTSNALESLFKYIRADTVFAIQKRGPTYQVVKCVRSNKDAKEIEGQRVPTDSVFHPLNHSNSKVPNDSRCDFDLLMLGKGGDLFAIEACEVQSAKSRVKHNGGEKNFRAGQVAIMYLCVAGKREFDFEYQFFSETDKAILAQVASAIAAHLNTSKLASGYRDLNVAFNKARKKSGSSAIETYTLASDLQDKFNIDVINRLLPRIVQNVGSCFVASKSGKSGEVIFVEGSQKHFNLHEIESCIEKRTFTYQAKDGYINCVKIYTDKSEIAYYFCYHTLALQIAHYKAELISFLINEFRVNFQEFLEIERRVNMMAQFQHATKGPLAAAVSALKMLSNRTAIYSSNPNMLSRLSKTNAHRSALTDSLLWIEKSRQLGDFAQILVEGYSDDQVIWQDTDISELVQSSVDLFRGYAKSRGKRISLKIDESIRDRIVSCDYRAIEVVIHNLIDNGIKYGHRDKNITVRLSLDDEVKTWLFAVEDIGEPIPDEDSKAIYEFFRRSSDRRVTRRRSGMGLGLAICREILDAHTADHGLDFYQRSAGDSLRTMEVTFSFRMPLVGKGDVRQMEK